MCVCVCTYIYIYIYIHATIYMWHGGDAPRRSRIRWRRPCAAQGAEGRSAGGLLLLLLLLFVLISTIIINPIILIIIITIIICLLLLLIIKLIISWYRCDPGHCRYCLPMQSPLLLVSLHGEGAGQPKAQYFSH